jgi:type IV pilus assembly protein PilQ
MSSTISSLRRVGIGALLFAGMTLQALAQGANRLEGITFTTGAGNKVELTLKLSDTAPTPLTFTVDNPARIALDLPDTAVAMSSRRVDVKQGVVDTVNVAEAGGRTRVVLNVDSLVPYETRVNGNTIVVSVGGSGSRAVHCRSGSLDCSRSGQPEHALRRPDLRFAQRQQHRFPSRH